MDVNRYGYSSERNERRWNDEMNYLDRLGRAMNEC